MPFVAVAAAADAAASAISLSIMVIIIPVGNRSPGDVAQTKFYFFLLIISMIGSSLLKNRIAIVYLAL